MRASIEPSTHVIVELAARMAQRKVVSMWPDPLITSRPEAEPPATPAIKPTRPSTWVSDNDLGSRLAALERCSAKYGMALGIADSPGSQRMSKLYATAMVRPSYPRYAPKNKV